MTLSCPLLALRPHRTGYHGPCHRGHRRCVRAAKRAEAFSRCRRAAAAPLSASRRGVCLWPWKQRYATEAEARAALRRIRERADRSRQVEPFACRNGRHWHLGHPKPVTGWPR